jgi:hypothetical protein
LQIIRERRWKEVTAVFNFPSTATNASFVLRKYYFSLLHHYERIYFFKAQGPPVSSGASIQQSPSFYNYCLMLFYNKTIFVRFFDEPIHNANCSSKNRISAANTRNPRSCSPATKDKYCRIAWRSLPFLLLFNS